MILFEPLYDSIVNNLAYFQGATIQELHNHVIKDHKISLPNFYKIIGRLVDDQILIKENGKLFFHTRWLLGFMDIAKNLENNCLTTDTNVNSLQEGQSLYYEATSIKNLDGVWGDWMLAVNKKYGPMEDTYVYQAHPYYALGMENTEMAFFSQVSKVSTVYFLTGNTNFLDQEGVKRYKKIGVKAIASDILPFLKEGYCTTVVGDYIFYVLYPKEITEYFQMFFSTIQNMKDFNSTLFSRIFTMKANCKLTLRYDKQQAKEIKEIFGREFKH